MEFLKSSRGKFIVTAVAAPAFFLFLIYGVMGKIFFEIRNASYAVSSGKASLDFLDKRTEIAAGNKKKLEKFSPDAERIKKTLFDKERPLEFIETLENTAKLSGNSIEITPIEGKDSLNTFLISADGDFQSLFKFLKLIEVMPYRVNLEEVSFEKKSSAESVLAQAGRPSRAQGALRLNITLKVETK